MGALSYDTPASQRRSEGGRCDTIDSPSDNTTNVNRACATHMARHLPCHPATDCAYTRSSPRFGHAILFAFDHATAYSLPQTRHAYRP